MGLLSGIAVFNNLRRGEWYSGVQRMTKKELKEYFSKMGRKGGKARLDKMSPEDRQKIAREGGIARAKKAKKQAGKSVQNG